MRDHKKEAQKWLESLRSGTIHYDGALWSLRRDVLGGGLTLEDIGTSEKELEELRVKGCKNLAQELLESLRSGIDRYESFLKCLRKEVQKGGLTLEDIGTSEEELEELRVKNCKALAQECLDFLRSGADNYESFLEYLRKEVQKGGFTLEDIGTSEEELEELRPVTVKER